MQLGQAPHMTSPGGRLLWHFFYDDQCHVFIPDRNYCLSLVQLSSLQRDTGIDGVPVCSFVYAVVLTYKKLISRWDRRTLLPKPRRRCKIYHPYTQTHFPRNVRVSYPLIATFSAHRDFFYYCTLWVFLLTDQFLVVCCMLNYLLKRKTPRSRPLPKILIDRLLISLLTPLHCIPYPTRSAFNPLVIK